MKERLKKGLSCALAVIMLLGTGWYGSTLISNAATTTIKSLASKHSSSNETVDVADINSFKVTSNTTVKSSDFTRKNASTSRALKDQTASEQSRLGAAWETELDKSDLSGDGNYTITFTNLDIGSSKLYDLTIVVQSVGAKIFGMSDSDRYIAFFEKDPGSMRFSGYKYVNVAYKLTNAGTSLLSENLAATLAFKDIDSHQAVEIVNANTDQLKSAWLASNSVLTFTAPTDDLPSSAVRENTVYCPNKADVSDATWNATAQKYALFATVLFTTSNNKLSVRYYAGGASMGTQTNGVFMEFESLVDDNTNVEPNVTKKVNGATSDVVLSKRDETFEYTLSTNFGNSAGSLLSSFYWQYTLENALEYSGTPTVTRSYVNSAGTEVKDQDVTSWFDIATSGQNITAAVKASHLTDADMSGTFTLHFNAKIKDDASLSSYYDSSRTYAVIPNNGTETINLKKSGNAATATSNIVNVKVKLAELALDKVVDKYEHRIGDKVDFTITVNNKTADSTAFDVNVTDTIPTEFKVDSAEVSGVTGKAIVSGQKVTATAETLKDTETMKIVVHTTALETGNLKEMYNTAQATCWNIKNTSGHADDDAEVYVNSADLSVDKTSDKYEYEVGDTATFTVKLSNKKGLAENVVLTDELPEGMKLDYDSVKITGLPKSVTYHIAGTADPTNALNPEYCNEMETKAVTEEKSQPSDNFWKYVINFIPANTTATITFTATATSAGNGKESQNVVKVTSDNAKTVEDDAEFYINTADLSITKKYVNPYKEEKNDNRDDNEFRVNEDETGNEQVKYVVEVTSSGKEGTVAKNVEVKDLTLPDGLTLNYDDIQIVETAADGSQTTFTNAGGNGTTFKYHVAGTVDAANELNEDKYNEMEDRTPVIAMTKQGNGWVLTDSYLPDTGHDPGSKDSECRGESGLCLPRNGCGKSEI